jgi:PD-(D/E)XK nuclease superfamily
LELMISIDGTSSTLKLKIDRIDIKNGDEKDVVVIDYKTGNVDSFTRKAVLNGMLSQMPLYLWAISNKSELPPGGAFYWGIKPGSRFLDKTSNAVLADSIRIPVKSKQQQQLAPDDVIAIPILFMEYRLKWIIKAVNDGRFNQPLEATEHPPFELLSRTQNRVQELRKKQETMVSRSQHADGKLGNWYCAVSLIGSPVSVLDTEDAV